MSTRVAVVGATGRLGAQVCRVIESMPDWDVIARLDSQSDLQEMLGSDVVVDVTHPGVSATVVDFALEQGLPILVGTSGWSAERMRGLEKKVAAHNGSSVYIVPNFSSVQQCKIFWRPPLQNFSNRSKSSKLTTQEKLIRPPEPRFVRQRRWHAFAKIGAVLLPHTASKAPGRTGPRHSCALSANPGVVASQDIVFGGVGETLTVSHNTSSQDAYSQGIALSLRYLVTHKGLTVGLEHALGLGAR